jgi:predicted GTPase
MAERVVLAGDAGSVMAAAAGAGGRAEALLVEGLAERTGTPWDIEAVPVDDIPDALRADVVELHSGERRTRDTVADWAASVGAAVRDGVRVLLQPPDGVRCVSVESLTTGSGKTALAARVARALQRSGVAVAVVRHPLASALGSDAPPVNELRRPEDLHAVPLDLAEEIVPVLHSGAPVWYGTDPAAVMAEASRGTRVLVWDGGGSGEPWIRPDLRLFAVDLLRRLPPGAVERLAAADVIVLTKADTANPDRAAETESAVREHNPGATTILADMAVAVREGPQLVSRRVVIVEDWPSLLLGGLRAGAGAVAARRFRCGVVDPRPFAVGSIARALSDHPHVGAVIPSLGRTPGEVEDLRLSVLATPGDVVLWASQAPPGLVLPDTGRPVFQVRCELIETAGGSLQDVLRPLLPGHDPTPISRDLRRRT